MLLARESGLVEWFVGWLLEKWYSSLRNNSRVPRWQVCVSRVAVLGPPELYCADLRCAVLCCAELRPTFESWRNELNE